MNPKIPAFIFLCASMVTPVSAAEFRLVGQDHSSETRFCIAAANDDMEGLRREIRRLRQSAHIQYTSIVNSIRCNGALPAQFAIGWGASETFSYLYNLTSKRNREQLKQEPFEQLAMGVDGAEQDLVVVQVSGIKN